MKVRCRFGEINLRWRREEGKESKDRKLIVNKY